MGCKGNLDEPGDVDEADAGAQEVTILYEEVDAKSLIKTEEVQEVRGDVDNTVDEVNENVGDMTNADHDVDGRKLPIYCVDTQEKKIALTFDAAWGNEDTEEILEILERHNLHVTFFMTGGWVESYPDDVKAILEAGHDLGNHSESHPNMSQLSDEEKKVEIMKVHEKVKELTGYEMFLFRPPYGDYDNAVVDVLLDCSYYPIQWDVDSLDWQNKGIDSIIETVTEHKNLGNGSIVLCHNGAEYTAAALDTLIDNLEEEGYEIVPLSELIYRDNYHLNHEGRQIKN
ncbi:MAG: polysaccharide deacetylase family protein [Lachnospiraceae bacterium]|nr:polysaccharide deacetylase family protein [Lachnospiraceae bacterium]